MQFKPCFISERWTLSGEPGLNLVQSHLFLVQNCVKTTSGSGEKQNLGSACKKTDMTEKHVAKSAVFC